MFADNKLKPHIDKLEKRCNEIARLYEQAQSRIEVLEKENEELIQDTIVDLFWKMLIRANSKHDGAVGWDDLDKCANVLKDIIRDYLNDTAIFYSRIVKQLHEMQLKD